MLKSKNIFIVLFLILTVIVVAYLDYQIKIYNPTFYAGKVNGYLTRFVTIILMSTLFYVINDINPNRKLVRYIYSGITGFVAGIVFGIICYLIIGADNGIVYQIIAIIICYSSYFGLRKLRT